MKVKPPIYGLVEGLASCEQQEMTSFSLSNCRPFDVHKEKIRFGKRPGTAKWSDTQISGAEHPVLALVALTTTYITPEA